MDKNISKKDAIDFLEIDEKTFDNYFKNAQEFNCIKRLNNKGKFYFDTGLLQKLLDNYKWRSIELKRDDYLLCLDFALAQHFRGYVLSDWGTARQREFGQKISNWVRGQLAEVAVKKFFQKEFNTRIELDFAIHDNIIPQDIVSVFEKGKNRKPKIGVGIKSSKPKSAYLVLGENEVILSDRRSDVYIFCRPDMPDDHILRLTRDAVIKGVKGKQHFHSYKDQIPYFENIFCEIAGFCWIKELDKVKNIPGQDFDGIRYVKKSGLLHKSRQDWMKLILKL